MKKKYFLHPIVLLMGITFLIVCCQQQPKQTEQKEETLSEFNIEFSPYPPHELDSNATPEQLVSFAWNEFLALNWKSSYYSNGKRDYPDTAWSYQSDNSPYPDLVVWETYAHRTEFRPASNVMQQFNNPPHYSFGTPLYPRTPQDSFNLFNNLDENNEIGSCDVYAHTDTFGKRYQVLYQAKVNSHEYNYVLNNFGTQAKLSAAISNTGKLIKTPSAYYASKAPCDAAPSTNVLCLPCGDADSVGSMEVKTAWRQLTTRDDPSRFFTRKVITYEKSGDSIYYVNKTYGLIGLHIIHKTRNYPAFVFATFEQMDVQNDSMGYVLLNKGVETGPLYGNYPRLHPITAIADSSTNYVHGLLKQKNPNSIWQYYRLTGVQGTPTNDTTSFNFFLANYVIESDSTLGSFRGNGIGTPHNGAPNTLYKGQNVSMGGCQGCHGVAQGAGGDFSFLALTPSVSSPDIGLSTPKLQRYIKLFDAVSAESKATAKK